MSGGVGAAAAAAINTAAAIYIADRQLDIAQQAQDIANKLNEHMCENYYPCEIKLLNEVCNEPIAEVDYDEQAGRFATTARLEFAKIREELDRQFSRYCCGNHQRLLKDLAIAEAKATTDIVNYGYRVAEQRAQALNDLRYNRIFQTLGMGRGLASSALSYAQVAGSTFSNAGDRVIGSLNTLTNELAFRNRGNDVLNGLGYAPQSTPVALQDSFFGGTPVSNNTSIFGGQQQGGYTFSPGGVPDSGNQYNFYNAESLVSGDASTNSSLGAIFGF